MYSSVWNISHSKTQTIVTGSASKSDGFYLEEDIFQGSFQQIPYRIVYCKKSAPKVVPSWTLNLASGHSVMQKWNYPIQLPAACCLPCGCSHKGLPGTLELRCISHAARTFHVATPLPNEAGTMEPLPAHCSRAAVISTTCPMAIQITVVGQSCHCCIPVTGQLGPEELKHDRHSLQHIPSARLAMRPSHICPAWADQLDMKLRTSYCSLT